MESSIASSIEATETINDPFVNFLQQIKKRGGNQPTLPLVSLLPGEMGWKETLFNLTLLVLIFFLCFKLYLFYKEKKEEEEKEK
jgi:hypothetical protein